MRLFQLRLHVVLVLRVQVQIYLVMVCCLDVLSTFLIKVTKLKVNGGFFWSEFEKKLKLSLGLVQSA